MVDITLLMDRTEQLARESGIALYPNNPRTYCRLNELSGEIEWVIADRFGPSCVPTATSILSRAEAEKRLRELSGICPLPFGGLK